MREKEAANILPFMNGAGLFAVGQRGWTDYDPIQVALLDAFLLQFLVLEVEIEEHRNEQKGVQNSKSPSAVTDSKRGLTHESSDAALRHSRENVPRTLREYGSLKDPPLVAKRREHRVLSGNGSFDRPVIEDIPQRKSQTSVLDAEP